MPVKFVSGFACAINLRETRDRGIVETANTMQLFTVRG